MNKKILLSFLLISSQLLQTSLLQTSLLGQEIATPSGITVPYEFSTPITGLERIHLEGTVDLESGAYSLSGKPLKKKKNPKLELGPLTITNIIVTLSNINGLTFDGKANLYGKTAKLSLKELTNKKAHFTVAFPTNNQPSIPMGKQSIKMKSLDIIYEKGVGATVIAKIDIFKIKNVQLYLVKEGIVLGKMTIPRLPLKTLVPSAAESKVKNVILKDISLELTKDEDGNKIMKLDGKANFSKSFESDEIVEAGKKKIEDIDAGNLDDLSFTAEKSLSLPTGMNTFHMKATLNNKANLPIIGDINNAYFEFASLPLEDEIGKKEITFILGGSVKLWIPKKDTPVDATLEAKLIPSQSIDQQSRFKFYGKITSDIDIKGFKIKNPEFIIDRTQMQMHLEGETKIKGIKAVLEGSLDLTFDLQADNFIEMKQTGKWPGDFSLGAKFKLKENKPLYFFKDSRHKLLKNIGFEDAELNVILDRNNDAIGSLDEQDVDEEDDPDDVKAISSDYGSYRKKYAQKASVELNGTVNINGFDCKASVMWLRTNSASQTGAKFWTFFLSITINGDYKLSDLEGLLIKLINNSSDTNIKKGSSFLDKVELLKTQIFYSNLNKFVHPDLGVVFERGLGGYFLVGGDEILDKIENITGKDTEDERNPIPVYGQFSPPTEAQVAHGVRGPNFTLGVALPGVIPIKEGGPFESGSLRFQISRDSTAMTNFGGLEVSIITSFVGHFGDEPEDEITLTGAILFRNAMFNLRFSMLGIWQNPFKIKDLAIADVGMEAGINTAPFSPGDLGLTGKIYINDPKDDDFKYIHVALKFSKATVPGEKLKYALLGEVRSSEGNSFLGTKDLVNIVNKLTLSERKILNIPEFGYAEWEDIKINNAIVKIASEGARIGDIFIQPGYTIGGEIEYLDVTGNVELTIDKRGLTGRARLTPIELKINKNHFNKKKSELVTFLKITGKGPDEKLGTKDDGPMLNLKLTIPEQITKISGTIIIPHVITAETDVEISEDKTKIEIKGTKIFDLWRADIKIEGPKLIKIMSKPLKFEASMTNDFNEFFMKKIKNHKSYLKTTACDEMEEALNPLKIQKRNNEQATAAYNFTLEETQKRIELTNNLLKKVQPKLQNIIDQKIHHHQEKILEFNKLLKPVQDQLLDKIEKTKSALTQEINSLGGSIQQKESELQTLVQQGYNNAKQNLASEISLRSTIQNTVAQARSRLTSAQNAVQSSLNKAGNFLGKTVNSLSNWIKKLLNVTKAGRRIVSAINNANNRLDDAKNAYNSATNKLNATQRKINSYSQVVNNYANKQYSKIGGTIKEVYEETKSLKNQLEQKNIELNRYINKMFTKTDAAYQEYVQVKTLTEAIKSTNKKIVDIKNLTGKEMSQSIKNLGSNIQSLSERLKSFNEKAETIMQKINQNNIVLEGIKSEIEKTSDKFKGICKAVGHYIASGGFSIKKATIKSVLGDTSSWELDLKYTFMGKDHTYKAPFGKPIDDFIKIEESIISNLVEGIIEDLKLLFTPGKS